MSKPEFLTKEEKRINKKLSNLRDLAGEIDGDVSRLLFAFEQIHITLQAVLEEIHKEYPEIFDRFVLDLDAQYDMGDFFYKIVDEISANDKPKKRKNGNTATV